MRTRHSHRLHAEHQLVTTSCQHLLGACEMDRLFLITATSLSGGGNWPRTYLTRDTHRNQQLLALLVQQHAAVLQAGMGKAAELILNALKLEVSHLPPPSDPLQATPTASRTLSVATQLADLSGQGFPLDSESIAAGILVDAVAAQRLSLGLVDARLGSPVANLIEDVLKVRRLPSRVDLYDDVASR